MIISINSHHTNIPEQFFRHFLELLTESSMFFFLLQATESFSIFSSFLSHSPIPLLMQFCQKSNFMVSVLLHNLWDKYIPQITPDHQSSHSKIKIYCFRLLGGSAPQISVQVACPFELFLSCSFTVIHKNKYPCHFQDFLHLKQIDKQYSKD